jgi:HEAT repeat protein
MIARRGAGVVIRRGPGVAIAIVLLLLIFGCGRPEQIFGCGRPPPKSDFELGKEHFEASNYVEAMMRLELWLKEDPDDVKGHNTEARVMLAVIYHDNETRQVQYEAEFKRLQSMGEPGMAAVLKLMENRTIASRLGNTIGDILIRGAELSVPPLMAGMKGTNPRLRIYARDALIQIGEPAVQPLVQLLDDPDLYNRSRAVEALRSIGHKSAIEPLEAKLNDPSRLVQVQAAAALYSMGRKGTTRKVILDALASGDIQSKRVAARTLAEVIDDPPLNPVLKAMASPDADLRSYATRAVGKTRSPEAIQPLMKMLLEDGNDQVKASAAESLVEIGKPAVEPLIARLEEADNIELTIRLVQILGNIGDKKAIKPLEKVYNGTSNQVLQNEAARALNKID